MTHDATIAFGQGRVGIAKEDRASADYQIHPQMQADSANGTCLQAIGEFSTTLRIMHENNWPSCRPSGNTPRAAPTRAGDAAFGGKAVCRFEILRPGPTNASEGRLGCLPCLATNCDLSTQPSITEEQRTGSTRLPSRVICILYPMMRRFSWPWHCFRAEQMPQFSVQAEEEPCVRGGVHGGAKRRMLGPRRRLPATSDRVYSCRSHQLSRASSNLQQDVLTGPNMRTVQCPRVVAIKAPRGRPSKCTMQLIVLNNTMIGYVSIPGAFTR